ncbi:MAG: VWA domain-containing protein [Vicinamibacterales bacterium]
MSRAVSARVLVAGLACAVVFFWAGARQPSAQGDIRERTLFVSALDRMDNPVEGLGPADLIVREDGVQREVLRVSRATEALEVAVLVDNAATSDSLIPRVREGLKAFIAALTPQHSVALVALADRPTILVDYTTNRDALIAGSQRLFTMNRSGATLLDAIVEVSTGLRRREAARTAIVPIVTDGVEYSNRRYQDVLDAITASGAGFYPIAVGRFPMTPATVDGPEHERTVVISSAPEASGGRRFDLLASSAIEGAMAKVARILTSQYKVVYSRPETLIPPEKVQIATTRTGVIVTGTPARVPGGSAK